MIASFKPRVEVLEDRLVMSNLQIADLTSVAIDPNGSVPGATSQAVSGRITGIAVDPTDSSGNTYYVSTANGGVWKTTDGGRVSRNDGAYSPAANWTSSLGKYLTLRPRPVDAGAGDAFYGTGIYKTTDGGQTWSPLETSLSSLTSPGEIGTPVRGANDVWADGKIITDENSTSAAHIDSEWRYVAIRR